jgi:DNA-binding SARP family transcriptional activator/tetratricopeptide (TPR) repeat protein
MDTEKITIGLLGLLEVTQNGEQISVHPSKKTRALLAYLAATGKPHTREHLCDLLWDGPADPRAELRWSLSKLRNILNSKTTNRIIGDHHSVRLKPVHTEIDLLTVQNLIASSPEKTSTDDLRTAADLFRGEFLEGLTLSGCYRFDIWCTSQREYIRKLRDEILSTLIKRFASEPETALHYARERLVVAPYSEEPYIDLIRLLGETGNTHEAMEQYERCKKMLIDEIGTRPSQELESVRKNLPRTAPAVAKKSKHIERQRYLISSPYSLTGRENEKAIIQNFIDNLQTESSPNILLFSGEPGIGKSRMLDEFAAKIYKMGGDVLTGRTFDIEVVRPYGAWIDALRMVPHDLIAPGIRKDLAPLLPELSKETSPVEKRNRIFDAVVSLLNSIAGTVNPLAIILDDIHWFDEASAALLHYIVRNIKEFDILFACSARQAELEQNAPAYKLVNTFRREGRIIEHTLSPLTLAETTALVRSIGAKLDGRHIYSEGKGNPLYSIEIARSETRDQSIPSKTLEHLIAERLVHLSPQSKELIPFIASLGQTFDIKTLEVVLDRPTEEIIHSIEELEQHGIIQVTGSSEYSFTHELIRRSAYMSTSEPRRRLIHMHIAKQLSSNEALKNKLAADLAHHAYLGGEYELAAHSLLAAAQHALRIFAYEEVDKLASRGLRQITGLSQETRLELQFKYLELYVDPGMRHHLPENIIETLSNAIAEAKTMGYDALVWKGLVSIKGYYYLQGDFYSAYEISLQSEKLGRKIADSENVIRAIALTARCLAMIERDIEKAEQLAHEASTLESTLNPGNKVNEINMAFGLIHHFKGNLDESYQRLKTALEIARKEGGKWWECYCHLRLVMIELERGRPEEALQQCRLIKPFAMRIKDGSEGPFTEALEALASIQTKGDKWIPALDDAIERLRKADSQWMVSYIQSLGADILLDKGNPEEARRRTEEALSAAEAIDDISAIAVSYAILTRIAHKQKKRTEAGNYLRHIKKLDRSKYSISARARREIQKTEKIIPH